MQVSRWPILLLIAGLLSACAGQPPVRHTALIPPVVRSANTTEKIAAPHSGLQVITSARKMLGTPYRYGGKSPSGFDCSGLVSYAYRSAGIQVPRTSNDQFQQSRKVALPDLQPGDLLFFRLQPPKVSHVAIYDQDGRFIHAPSSGKTVSYASLDNPYWREHLVAVGRFR